MNSKKVLMIAFHFPPQAGSSGILRTLNFAKYLPANGWTPIVLSANPRAYEECRDDLLKSIPKETKVIRAFALDAARHLGIMRKYPSILALPDRWSTWWFGAVWAGLKEIRKEKPSVIWSTYPITSAHLIGATLAKISGLPWVADFRDPMINGDYPSEPLQRRSWQWLESLVLRTATYCIFTTERAAEVYRQRYPAAAVKCMVIENGYDEDAFVGNAPMRTGVGDEQTFMLHSGIIYPRDRDPSAFFAAIASLIDSGSLERERLKVRFRAPHHDEEVAALAHKYGLDDVVEIAPPIPYRDAIGEMMGADLLLVFQGRHFNSQIPAKIYEYLRTGKPLLGLVDQSGDTATQLRKFDGVALADISDQAEICSVFQSWYSNHEHLASLASKLNNINLVKRYSRASHTERLAALMNKLCQFL
ncbi:MAG: glycosyltransferase [Azonexus sp.]|nr:glycosyltransferase [Azonexus sp.]